MATPRAKVVLDLRLHLQLRVLDLSVALLAAPAIARGQPLPADWRGEDLEVYVLTFGPGSDLFTMFGHNALWFRNRVTHEDVSINFGTIPPADNLALDFVKGKMRYSVSAGTLEWSISAWLANDHQIDAQELELAPGQAALLYQKARTAALPENRWYTYDYYLDNCSTKVRDLVDEALGGRLRAVSQGPATFTWREHSLRLTARDPVSYPLGVGLGPAADGPQTRWDEMFLPSVLATTLGSTTVERDGKTLPLVRRRFSLHDTARPPEPSAPPDRRLQLGVAGAGLGVLLAALGLLARGRARPSPARRALAGALWTLAGLVGLLAGSFGAVLLHFWVNTDHTVAHRNENLFQFSPLALGLPALALLAPLWRGATRWASTVALLLLIASALGLALDALPFFRQTNAEYIALAIPIWAGLALGLRALR